MIRPLDVRCPKCGVLPHNSCEGSRITPGGRTIHAERVRDALIAGLEAVQASGLMHPAP